MLLRLTYVSIITIDTIALHEGGSTNPLVQFRLAGTDEWWSWIRKAPVESMM